MQAVRLMTKADPADLARQVENRDLRAAAYFPFGCFQAITFTHEIGPTNYQLMSLDGCQPPDCVLGVPLPGFLSNHDAQAVVGFAVLEPEAGSLGLTVSHLEETSASAPDGMVVTYAPLFGSCDTRIIAEVLGDSEVAVLEQLQRVVDVRGLKHVSTLLTFGSLTWGFGTEADPAEGALPPAT